MLTISARSGLYAMVAISMSMRPCLTNSIRFAPVTGIISIATPKRLAMSLARSISMPTILPDGSVYPKGL